MRGTLHTKIITAVGLNPGDYVLLCPGWSLTTDGQLTGARQLADPDDDQLADRTLAWFTTNGHMLVRTIGWFHADPAAPGSVLYFDTLSGYTITVCPAAPEPVRQVLPGQDHDTWIGYQTVDEDGYGMMQPDPPLHTEETNTGNLEQDDYLLLPEQWWQRDDSLGAFRALPADPDPKTLWRVAGWDGDNILLDAPCDTMLAIYQQLRIHGIPQPLPHYVYPDDVADLVLPDQAHMRWGDGDPQVVALYGS